MASLVNAISDSLSGSKRCQALCSDRHRCWHGIPTLSAPSIPSFGEHGGPARRVSCSPQFYPPRISASLTAALIGGIGSAHAKSIRSRKSPPEPGERRCPACPAAADHVVGNEFYADGGISQRAFPGAYSIRVLCSSANCAFPLRAYPPLFTVVSPLRFWLVSPPLV